MKKKKKKLSECTAEPHVDTRRPQNVEKSGDTISAAGLNPREAFRVV